MTMPEVLAALLPLRPRALALTKNPDDAEDLLHDTFLRAMRFVDKFEPQTSLGSWLNTMMYHIFLDSLRSGDGKAGKYTYRRRTVSLESMPGFEIPVEFTADSEWDAAHTIELFQELTPDHRIVLELATDGATYEEMARIVGRSMGTVKSRLNRARAELKAKLAA